MLAIQWEFYRFTLGFDTHRRIIWALLMRELSTRYGRNNIGFLWIVAEPLIFAAGVSLLWTAIKPAREHGIGIIPFVITGYMPLILFRQTVGYCISSVRVNNSLLYHRQITPIHMFFSRFLVEFIGTTLAFVISVTILCLAGLMRPPHLVTDFVLIYSGWVILAALSFGIALTMGALSEIFEFVERFIQVFTYVVVPLSGSFYMVAWIPPLAQKWVLRLPFIHSFEMIRGGFFGEFVTVHYNVPYVLVWVAGFNLLGLAILAFVRDRVEVD